MFPLFQHLLPVGSGLALLLGTSLGTAPEHPPERTHEPRVDLAICLDTSGSMRGLIDSARQGIWAIVNDLALAEPTPRLRVALLTFGNDGHAAENGWVAVATGFTEDLDLVSERLFELTTNGGTELVGRVVDTAVDRLEWSDDPQALKLLVVAGNESADQDQVVRYADACKKAISTGIQINSIYCGNPMDELAPAWREVATLADGRFHAIDHNQAQVAIATPFDDQLTALNASLNDTYLPYGSDGQRGCSNQLAQDWNANTCNSEVVAQRVLAKSTSNYSNTSWDLVDADEQETVKLEEMKDEELPESLRGKTLEEKREIVRDLRTRRADVQRRIQEVAKKRSAHILEARRAQAQDPSTGFDLAVRHAVRTQAAARGLEIQGLPPEIETPAQPGSRPTTGENGAGAPVQAPAQGPVQVHGGADTFGPWVPGSQPTKPAAGKNKKDGC